MVRFFSSLCLAAFVALAAHERGAEGFTSSRSISRTAFVAPQHVATTAIAPRSSAGFCLKMSTAESPKSVLVRKPDSAVEITLTATGQETKMAYEKTCADFSKKFSIPGFRKGAKIPPNVLENAVAQQAGTKNPLKAQVINNLLSRMVETAIRDEHSLEPIGQATLTTPAEDLADNFVPGESFEMTVTCDVWPEIKWKEVEGQEKPYFGLTGSYKRKHFNQEKMDVALKDLRDRYATLEPMEEGGILAMGDACVVNMEGFMANEDGSKGEPLPAAASGENVEVILGEGRYMEGLVEGLIGGKVGDTKTVTVSFPEKLKDKTLAGKRAVFDVTIQSASHRTIPEVTDEFADMVRSGLTAESLMAELRKAIDSEDLKEYVNERNEALGKAVSEIVDVEVPDSLITSQCREKYAIMMTEFRDNGMADDEIKKLISPENFLKYKDIQAPDIRRDFRTSMAIDEIARLEKVEVPSNSVDEQLVQLKKEAEQANQEFDEKTIREKVETTLLRRMVYDLLNEHANLEVEYTDEEFDEELMNKLAEESLAREQNLAGQASS